ncbi:MAG: hypothetical protein K6E97_09820 [Treponema sp.]|nr:hypothetical protein [Treponema sp.]
MKKFIIGLLTLVMVFGFAGCKKDAEEDKWIDTEVYFIYEEYENDKWAYIGLSFTKPSEGVYYDRCPCFIKKDSGITKCTQMEYFEYENGAFKDGELAPDSYLFEFEETTIESLTYNFPDFLKLEGYLIICKGGLPGPDYSLTVPEEIIAKEIWTFDDGSTLTVYQGLDSLNY